MIDPNFTVQQGEKLDAAVAALGRTRNFIETRKNRDGTVTLTFKEYLILDEFLRKGLGL